MARGREQYGSAGYASPDSRADTGSHTGSYTGADTDAHARTDTSADTDAHASADTRAHTSANAAANANAYTSAHAIANATGGNVQAVVPQERSIVGHEVHLVILRDLPGLPADASANTQAHASADTPANASAHATADGSPYATADASAYAGANPGSDADTRAAHFGTAAYLQQLCRDGRRNGGDGRSLAVRLCKDLPVEVLVQMLPVHKWSG